MRDASTGQIGHITVILYKHTVFSSGAMYVKVAQLYEDGRPLPRHRSITAQPIKMGSLHLVEEHSREFRRNIVYAILCGPAGAEVIPRLHDAVVRHISDGCMTISGFERDDLTGACRGQSWFVQVHLDTKEHI